MFNVRFIIALIVMRIIMFMHRCIIVRIIARTIMRIDHASTIMETM